MEYRNYNDVIYLRLDRGDEVLTSILEVCKKEGIHSCIFSGIGGCEISTMAARAMVRTIGDIQRERCLVRNLLEYYVVISY